MLTYPHHLTTDLPPLPVPPLGDSLERFRIASAAVYDAAEEAAVNQAIADFALGPGPELQQTLEEYAEATAEPGSNWMAEHYLERALKNREPLQLSNNSTFQLNVSTAAEGTERVVELLQRLGAVHVQQAKRQTEPEYDSGGRLLSMDPWAAVNGGIRTPGGEQDVWVRAGTGATYRTIGLLYFGRMWEVPLTGSEGKLLDTDHLRASVEYVLSQTQPPKQNFASISALGSDALAADSPWDHPDNRDMYNRLTNMLFTITLDPAAQDADEALPRWAFLPGYAWVYKPISYIMALDSDLLAAHVEHSVLEAGTLATVAARAQEVDLGELDTQHDGHLSRAHELVWHDANYELGTYIQRAIGLRTQRVVVRREEQLPFDIGHDIRAQLILMIAQQLTYGEVRAHAQCCDMRHFRAGRTEIIRPVTVEAVDFVSALVRNETAESQLIATLSTHQEWVLAAKRGQAFDRHFEMLTYIGQELGGANADVLRTYRKAREYFITTTSIDGQDAFYRQVRPMIEADGFGVSYATVVDGTEFIVTSQEAAPKADEFSTNLVTAAELLYDFIAGLPPITTSHGD